jgi:hypothetical protein
MANPDPLDWDSIRETEGFKVGDHVRFRGRDVGIIRNLIQVKGRIRARVHWPTIPFEGSATGHGSENFVDLAKLSLVPSQASDQLTLI